MSSEYGWTTDHVLDLTIYEIKWRLEHIFKRKDDERIFSMSINGIDTTKIANKPTQEEDELTEKEKKQREEVIDKAFEEAKRRKAKEWRKN